MLKIFEAIFGPIDSRSVHQVWQDKKSSAIAARETILNSHPKASFQRQSTQLTGFVSSLLDRKQRKILKSLITPWLPKYIFSGDKVKYSSKRGLFNYPKQSQAALNNRYTDIHDKYGNTKFIVLDCDSSIPEDFDSGEHVPFMIVKNAINGHSHLWYPLDRRTKTYNPSYVNKAKSIAGKLRDIGLNVENKVLLRARSPLFNPGRRKRSFEIRDGRDYAEADYHFTQVLSFNPKLLKLSETAKGSFARPVAHYEASIATSQGSHRHDYMIEASHDERFAWLRKHGSITVEEAFGIYKKYASDLKDSDIMNDARCFVRWTETKHTGNGYGQGDWFNGMYLNVPLDEMRQRGWNNYRAEHGETKLDCSKRMNIPYWKVKDLCKKGLLVMVEGLYDLVNIIDDKMSDYVAFINENVNKGLSTNSGDDENNDVAESEVSVPFNILVETDRPVEEPPRPPPIDLKGLSARQLLETWGL